MDRAPATPDGVGRTAFGVAYARALETQRADRLFADPLAAAFVAASHRSPTAPPGTAATGEGRHGEFVEAIQDGLAIRTRFIDEVVLDGLAAGCRQVVALGAGLDARAFRLDWPPGSRLFEVDVPAVLGFKEDVLRAASARPRCERIVVACDLRDEWYLALEHAGFDPARPTTWIAEGLLIYLSDAENDELLERIGRRSAPGSHLGVTFAQRKAPAPEIDDGSLRDPTLPSATTAALWRSDGPDDPVAWLAGHGWRASAFDALERARAYGREMVRRPGGRTGSGSLVRAVRV